MRAMREQAAAGGVTAGKPVLKVKMFGGFDLTYGDGGGKRPKKFGGTQFATLMQILLHYRNEGVSRAFLEEALFYDRELEDPHHSLQSVIYNAKKKLAAMGLPDVNCIVMEGGLFFWTKEIPVDEDASRFEALYAAAERCAADGDAAGALEAYVEACFCYGGEFLSVNAGVLWVARESRRYRVMFYDCVEKAAALLRGKEDWFSLEKLGVHAAKVAPFADWEALTMEALVETGRHAEAERLYSDTVELYFREQGIRPSKRCLDSLEKISSRMEHSCAMLDDIESGLLESDGRVAGGYICTWPVFQGIYQMTRRAMDRSGTSAHLMLCTILDSKGNPMKEGATLAGLTERLAEAIRVSVRVGDVISRYSKNQFLVLLTNTTLENCEIIQKRITANFVVGRQRTGVGFRVRTVLSV